jgi:uncharacterized protein YcbX
VRVTGLFRYPVKSLRGTALGRSTVEPIGLTGDRRWLVVDHQGRFQTIRQIPVMTQIGVAETETGIEISHDSFGAVAVATPAADAERLLVTVWRDTVPVLLADPSGGAFLSRIMGQPVRLVYMNDPASRPVTPLYGRPEDRTSFADAFPFLLTTEASLGDLNRRLALPVEMRRFRPNIVIDGTDAWAEDGWKSLRIGAVTFRVAKACGRCVVTTRDPDTGEQPDPTQPLQTLASFHRASDGGIIFGQNLIPETIGEIAIGDAVEILEAGASNLY